MSARTIVAVGGSGTHAAIAFMRLAILSNMKISEIPNLIVIDGDICPGGKGADNLKPSLMDTARKLHIQITDGCTGKAKPFFKHFEPYIGGGNQQSAVQATTEFGDYLIGSSVKTAPAADKLVLDALFTGPSKEGSGRSEQEIQISRGFFARPSVGATATYDLLNQPQSPLQQSLMPLLGKTPGSIAVIGSSTGGTGSGGAPALAQWLVTERRERKSETKIALFMSLPWFAPSEQVENSNKERTNGDESTQRQNAAAGVRLYAESIALAEAGLFLADLNGHMQVRDDDGNYGQPEYPHVFNLMMASQIQNFFLAAERKAEYGVVGNYSFFHQPTNGTTSLHIKADDSPLVAFSASNVQRQDIQDWAIETQSIRLLLEKLATFIENAYRVENAQPIQRPKMFADLMLELARKMGPEATFTELNGGFMGFGAHRREAAQVRSELANCLRSRSATLSATVAWLDELRRNSDSPEASFVISDPSVRKTFDSKCHVDYPIYQESKARDAIVTVLAVFERSFSEKETNESTHPAERVLQLFQDLTNPDGGAISPVEAAAKVIETQIRAFIQKKLIGAGRRMNDAGPWVAGQRTAIPLLPMRVETRPVNHYLVSFTLGRLVDEGENRHGDTKQVSDPMHPFTISGLVSANIPSPWAAAKLQSWTQMHGDRDQKLRATHRIESITWGIFTKRLVPRNVPLGNTRLGMMLKTSLDAELNSPELRKLDSLLVACDANNEDEVVAVNHPIVGWYLAPSLAAEENASDILGWWKLARFSFILPSEIVRDGKHVAGSFSMRKVRSYVNYLEQLTSNHQADANNVQYLPWYNSIREIILDLREQVVGVEPIPLEKLANFQLKLRVRKQEGSSTKWGIGNAGVYVLSQSASDITRKYLPSYLVLLDNKNGILAPASPVLPAFIKTVKASLRGVSEDGSGEYSHRVRYTLEIEGLGSHDVELPAKEIPFRTHVGIWPNFSEADWNYYYVGCEPSYGLDSKNDLRFGLYNSAGELLGGDEHRTFRTNHEILGVPAFLCIETVEGDEIFARGLYAVGLDEIASPNMIFKMGLDIGTSHSCFYAEDSQGIRIEGLDFSRAKELGHVIFNYLPAATRTHDELRFLGLFAAREQHSNQCVIPSELRVHERTGEPVGAGMLVNKSESGRNFATTPLIFKTEANAAKGRGKEFLSDFKWPAQRQWAGSASHGLAGTAFEAHQVEVLRIYMLQFMRVGFALLRKKGFKVVDVFRATYPEAFEKTMVDAYARQLANLLNELPDTTGIRYLVKDSPTNRGWTPEALLAYRENPRSGVTAADSFMLSESLAAIGAGNDNVAGPLQVPGVCLVLDMGGGTTDIALYVTAQKGTDPIQVESLTDSIRYAGNDLLGLLATPRVLAVLVQAVNPDITQEAIATMSDADRFLTLKRTIREEKAALALRTAMASGDFAPEVCTAIGLFFQGLIDYSGFVVKPYLKKFSVEKRRFTVSVILLGNGWLLSDLIWNQDTGAAAGFIRTMEQQLSPQLGQLGNIDVKYHTNEDVSVKESIAMGAARFGPAAVPVARMNQFLSVPGFPINLTIDGQLHKVDAGDFMELKCVAKNLVNAIEIDSIDILPLAMREHLALLLKVDIGDLGDRLKMTLQAHIEQFINGRLHSMYPFRISPLALMLEGLWKKVVISAAKKG